MRSTSRARALVGGLVAALMLATLLAVPVTPAAAEHEPLLPIVYVHGGQGSAAQYETQALRWASNGYPFEVRAIDRISATAAVINPILDDFFDDVLAETGAEKVYVVGHSQGVAVMNNYLNSSSERAARVAKYIGIDSASGPSPDVCPGGVDADGDWNVPCMGVWGRGDPNRTFGPDHNVYFPEQGHTEVVGSADSFAAQYEFLTGHAPATTFVLPEPPGQVQITGRALNFPANTGIEGATVQLWRVHPSTGARVDDQPVAQTVVDSSGNWGPWGVNGQHRYEITVLRDIPDQPGELHSAHFYYEPWTRSNHLIRLNLAPLGSFLSNTIASHAGPHAVASIVRQKEWWGNNAVDPTNVDDLFVSTTSASLPDQPPIDMVTAGTAPFAASTIAMITLDINADGVTNVENLTPLGPFLSGVDVYMPATDPPDGVITFHAEQRRAGTQVISTPNWSQEDAHSMTVTFRDWVQPIERWGDCMRARPSPCR